jgi:hypothetical protein
MRTVSVAQTFPGSVHEAEMCWYDTDGWPAWVNGFDQVERVTGNWPGNGSTVTWRSGPAGRGRVTERVIAHEALAGQTVEVQDDSITGRQSVEFTPAQEGVQVRLTLQYRITRRTPFTPLVDLLFIRRAMETSLRTTLAAFGAELASLKRH